MDFLQEIARRVTRREQTSAQGSSSWESWGHPGESRPEILSITVNQSRMFILECGCVQRRPLKSFVAGLILGLLLVFAGVYFYFASGSAPVATDAQAMPFEKKFAQMALNARVEKEMPKSVPVTADETAYRAGADIYREHCAVCHGLPGQPATAIAKGMFPKPPVLLEGKGVTDDPAQETIGRLRMAFA